MTVLAFCIRCGEPTEPGFARCDYCAKVMALGIMAERIRREGGELARRAEQLRAELDGEGDPA